jgi:hypothetical protein
MTMETPHNPSFDASVAISDDDRDADGPRPAGGDRRSPPAAVPIPPSPTRYTQPSGMRKHPMIVLTGLWLVLLVLGWLSMSEILSPGADAPLPKTTIGQVKQQDQSSSLGVLGAVAAGCAVLSLMLSQKLDRR